ncbi:HDIG domain-containing metalloprotein [Salinirubellus sp. GCM10025818]|uniref:HDIG domain-containing metalloprotein n=1 Tax=Salinirubellus TaxID=2162630 RepID=UPI0030D22A47
MPGDTDERNTDIDYEDQVREAFPEIESIADADLREKTVEVWTLALDRGGWRDVHDVPHTWNIPEPNTVAHLRGVFRAAIACADVQEEFYGIDVDRDVVRVLALTHDVGKCLEYTVHVDDDLLVDPDPRYAGDDVPHQLSGYALAAEVGLPPEVTRGIPHGRYAIPGKTIEAALIESANSVSTNAMTMQAMGLTIEEWTEKHH